MPRLDGLAATKALHARSDPPRVIVLTTFDADDHVVAALAAGADGFLLKDTPPAQIIAAIRAVAAGDPMLSPSVTRTLIRRLREDADDDRVEVAERRLALLTERERDVALAVGRGLSNAEIAARAAPLGTDGEGARLAPLRQARVDQPGADRDLRPRRRPGCRPAELVGRAGAGELGRTVPDRLRLGEHPGLVEPRRDVRDAPGGRPRPTPRAARRPRRSGGSPAGSRPPRGTTPPPAAGRRRRASRSSASHVAVSPV